MRVLGDLHQRGEQRLKVGLEEAGTNPRHRNNCQVDDSGRNMEHTPLPNLVEASKSTLGEGVCTGLFWDSLPLHSNHLGKLA